jgi:hypothetical protein
MSPSVLLCPLPQARTSHLRHLRSPTRTRTPPSRHVICLQLMAHTHRAWDRFHIFRSREAPSAASPLHVHHGSDTSRPLMGMAAVSEFAGSSVNSGTVPGWFPSSHIFFESYYVEQRSTTLIPSQEEGRACKTSIISTDPSPREF